MYFLIWKAELQNTKSEIFHPLTHSPNWLQRLGVISWLLPCGWQVPKYSYHPPCAIHFSSPHLLILLLSIFSFPHSPFSSSFFSLLIPFFASFPNFPLPPCSWPIVSFFSSSPLPLLPSVLSYPLFFVVVVPSILTFCEYYQKVGLKFLSSLIWVKCLSPWLILNIKLLSTI